MVRRCLCVLLVDYHSRYQPQASPDAVAEQIVASGIPEADHGCFRNTVLKMMSRGGYYRHLEASLGKGVIFALGINIAETT